MSLRAYKTNLEGVPRDPSVRGATALKLIFIHGHRTPTLMNRPLTDTEKHLMASLTGLVSERQKMTTNSR